MIYGNDLKLWASTTNTVCNLLAENDIVGSEWVLKYVTFNPNETDEDEKKYNQQINDEIDLLYIKHKAQCTAHCTV